MVCYDSSNVLGGGYHMRCKNKIRTLQMGMLAGLMAFAIPVLTGAEDALERNRRIAGDPGKTAG